MNDSRRPRVLVLTSTFPRWEGDATPRFVRDLAVAASSAFDVTVLAPHHPGARPRERMGPLDVRRFSYFVPSSLERLCYDGGILPKLASSNLARIQLPSFLVAEFGATLALLRAERFALVHAHWFLPQGVLAGLATSVHRLPLVVSAHGSDVFALRGPLFDAARRWLGGRAAALTANSDATREALVLGMPSARPHVLPVGVDEALVAGDAPCDASRDDALLFVGRLSRQKGLDALLDALVLARQRLPALRLDIVGNGPIRPSLEQRVAELGLGEHVTFLGARPHEEVIARCRRARAFVFPGRSEGQGLAVIEAMACGCPVVAARSGALGALIDQDARGLGVPDGDARALAEAVVRVCVDRDGAVDRARAARAFVARTYTWTAIAPRLHAIYREAIASPAGRSRWA